MGLDTPGPATVDGVIGLSPNLRHPDWNGFAIRAAVEARLQRPVIYANDGNAAAYWEYHRLFGDDDGKILAAAILGTGLGGALIWGGEVLVGARGYGGEFGHIRLPAHELVTDGQVPRCGCGQLGCAEAFVSVSALDHFLRRALALPEHRAHPLQSVPDEGRARALRLLGLAQQGDPLAQALFDQQADALGLLFVQLANCCDPDVFIIGGGITESSPAFRARYLDRVLRHLPPRRLPPGGRAGPHRVGRRPGSGRLPGRRPPGPPDRPARVGAILPRVRTRPSFRSTFPAGGSPWKRCSAWCRMASCMKTSPWSSWRGISSS